MTTNETLRTTQYHESVIQPCATGFGAWQMGEISSEGWELESDLLEAAADNGIDAYALGAADCPPAIEDIRGRITGEAGTIYGWLDEMGESHYFAIVERDAE